MAVPVTRHNKTWRQAPRDLAPLLFPVAHDALTARIVELAGYPAYPQPLHVTIECLVEVPLGNLAERGELPAAGVGEQHIQPPVLLLHSRVEPVEVRQVRHVPADPDDFGLFS
jgi:hypothetical protein